MRKWFGEDEGGECPTGCGCDCVAGKVREEKALAAEKEKREKGKGVVKSDELVVGESKAVADARVALGGKSV